MARLNPVANAALEQTEFKDAIASCLAGDIEWSDRSLKLLKDSIRVLLRKEQEEVCPYCQRVIFRERRNWNEHIEHILDKSNIRYKKFSFTATNIVLSCGPCNFQKSNKDLLPDIRPVPDDLSTVSASFLWPHPYFDDISACISKHPGPVYQPIVGSGREKEAQSLIRDLKLDDVANIESRASHLQDRKTRLFNILERLIERLTGENSDGSRKKMSRILQEVRRIENELS